MIRMVIFLNILIFVVCYNQALLGCYKDLSRVKQVAVEYYRPRNECINECFSQYFRYALLREQENCRCGNFLGEQISNTTCSECNVSICNPNLTLFEAYTTGSLVPGPPRSFQITNVTDHEIELSWEEPESFVEITKYQIKTNIIHTYSTYLPVSPEWMYPNNTYQAKIITLLPATKYNITLSTKSPEGDGAVVFRTVETRIADPDTLPDQPKILENEGTKITVKLYETPNNNGPVSAYRIIVMNSDVKQGFDRDDLLSYHEANKDGLRYYIAAEIDPKDIDKNFVVGDGRRYGKYYNAPLDPDTNYNIILAVVSRVNGIEKIAYSDPSVTGSGVLILDVNETEGDPPAVIIGLSVAIGLLTFMLIAGIIGFIILKSRVVNRRQRLSDNQELTLQGPMIEVENNGYIHEDDHAPTNHYRNLKQKVKIISSSQLKIEPTNLLGVGKYGRVNSGTLQNSDVPTPIAAYSIQDRKMSQETKKSMLQDLDVLIKVGKHDNLIELLGTCENSQMIIVVLEYASLNLKDLLLGSRDALPGKFSSMSEEQALDVAVQICDGMAYLESCKVVHKQLCARSILVANGFTPKISGYGISQYFSHNKIPDYTRFTAIEVFKNQPHNPRSDVWSFACLVWEIISLGGTPYGTVPNNNDIPEKIAKGLRLPQLQYISDEFYQIMLDCWQLNCDERPTFSDLIEVIQSLEQNSLIPPISFNMYPNFQYEQFYPDMELAVRPVF